MVILGFIQDLLGGRGGEMVCMSLKNFVLIGAIVATFV